MNRNTEPRRFPWFVKFLALKRRDEEYGEHGKHSGGHEIVHENPRAKERRTRPVRGKILGGGAMHHRQRHQDVDDGVEPDVLPPMLALTQPSNYLTLKG